VFGPFFLSPEIFQTLYGSAAKQIIFVESPHVSSSVPCVERFLTELALHPVFVDFDLVVSLLLLRREQLEAILHQAPRELACVTSAHMPR
jgi:hypothetical protein